jgi:receptor protein-tyrosine kinase
LALYATLVERQQELESIRALRSQSAVVVDPAQGAPKTKPRLVFGAMIGIIVGVLLGIAVALLRDAVENRPRSIDELQRQVGLPVLGRIPSSQEGATSLVTLAHPGSIDAEAYRLLRMNVEFAAEASGGTVFVLTSTVAGEGKSTVAANLAVALARVGRSVILVDSDPLRPVLRERFRIRASAPGLNDVVMGRASLDQALVEFSLPTISTDKSSAFAGEPELRNVETTQLVPVGRPSSDIRDLSASPVGTSVGGGQLRVLVSDPTPVEFSDYLVATRMEGLLGQLRHKAEIVLVDVPPLTTSVGMGVARLGDGVIVLANVQLMRRPMLDQLAGLLGEVATPKLGVVLTGLAPDEAASYGYHYPEQSQKVKELVTTPPATVKAAGRWSSAS